MKKLVLISCLFLVALAGCEKPAKEPFGKSHEPSTQPSLTIGILPEQQIFDQLDRYKPLTDYLSRKISRSVTLKVFSQYGNLIEEFSSASVDGAFLGSLPYALAHARFGVEPLARPRSLDGTSTYHGLIFVRKDSGIRTVRDMEGKRFAFVDKATMAGYLFPLAYFRKHGIANYKTYLREVYFTGTHEDAILDVLNRKADVGSAKNTVYERLAGEDRRIGNELVILERSLDVPENVLAVRKDLPPAVKAGLREALLDMEKDEEGRKVLKAFGALGFVGAKDEEYGPVIDYAKHLGLDLATYDYVNTP